MRIADERRPLSLRAALDACGAGNALSGGLRVEMFHIGRFIFRYRRTWAVSECCGQRIMNRQLKTYGAESCG